MIIQRAVVGLYQKRSFLFLFLFYFFFMFFLLKISSRKCFCPFKGTQKLIKNFPGTELSRFFFYPGTIFSPFAKRKNGAKSGFREEIYLKLKKQNNFFEKKMLIVHLFIFFKIVFAVSIPLK